MPSEQKATSPEHLHIQHLRPPALTDRSGALADSGKIAQQGKVVVGVEPEHSWER